MDQKTSFNVAVVLWSDSNGIATVIRDELMALGHRVDYLDAGSVIHNDVEVILSYGPYGRFLTVPQQLVTIPVERRPVFAHWNTEGIPDLRIPWHLMRATSDARSWFGRLDDADNRAVRALARQSPFARINETMTRYKYVGDYYFAYRRGLMDVFSDSSAVYAQLHRQHGLPTTVAPWGATPLWYADLGLERDIDVLWMGKRGSKRRSSILDRVRSELANQGVEIYMADNEENPFVFGDERTKFLNRAKITLNITRTWFDDNFSRFALAVPNRSLVVSEPVLPHCPAYEPGVHYVSASIETLSETILHYLEHDDERLRIVENGYHLATTELTFRKSINMIMKAVHQVHVQRKSTTGVRPKWSQSRTNAG